MRVFYAFLIIFAAVFLLLLPITEAVYDFRTDIRDDTFAVETGVGETTANVTLIKEVYDDDTETIDILSDLSSDSPAYGNYATATRELQVTGLTASENRTLTVSYDVDALVASPALNTLIGWTPYLWYICVFLFTPASLFAIFTGRV